MKTLKHLLVAAVAAFTFNTAFAAEASKNTALLTSPRYLEEHPELLRGQTFGGESKIASQARLTGNIALANSPRFREAHPELRLFTSSPTPSPSRSISETERLSKLTAHKALAASPRFREQHPEILRVQPVFQVAPLK
jgi:predicted nicotinamide N-methyase